MSDLCALSLHFPPRVLSAPSVPPPPLDLTEPERARQLFFPLSHFWPECVWSAAGGDKGGDSQPEKLQPRKPRGPFYLWLDVTISVHLPSSPRTSRLPRRRDKKEGRKKITGGGGNRERIKVRCGFCPLSHQRPCHPPSTRPQPTQLVNK